MAASVSLAATPGPDPCAARGTALYVNAGQRTMWLCESGSSRQALRVALGQGGLWLAVTCFAAGSVRGADMSTGYLVLLKKGPGWTAEESAKTKALQDAHMANIRAMWEAKKLIVAGPVGESDEIRGIFVFQVA